MTTRLVRFRRWRVLAYSSMIAYALIAHLLLPWMRTREIFPFFAWNMFAGQYDTFQIFQVEVETTLNGERYGCTLPDCSFSSTDMRSKTFFYVIQKLGFHYKRNSGHSVVLQRQLEASLSKVTPRPYMYSVIELKVNPVRFVTMHETISKKLLFKKTVSK